MERLYLHILLIHNPWLLDLLLTIPRTQRESLLSCPRTAMLVLRTEMARIPAVCLLMVTSCSLLSWWPNWSGRTERMMLPSV